jgi:alkylated DNA repair protein alkB family protein 1
MKEHIKRESIAYDGIAPLSETIFRQEEKKYKNLQYKDLGSDIIDFNNIHEHYKKYLTLYSTNCGKQIFSFELIPGLFILPQYLSLEEQKYWIDKSLFEYSNSTLYVNNLSNLNNSTITTTYNKDLRWARLGTSYDWNTSSYNINTDTEKSDMMKSNFGFPDDLKIYIKNIVSQIEKIDANTTKKTNYDNYNPEVAFINYYPKKSYMMAHQDKSEPTFDRPLVSISLGSSCIFLIGTENRNDKPYAFCLHSGDVIVMTGQSRLSFHGVPKIFETSHMNELRININVRQVYE